MAASVIVLCPNGRRQTVKVTPNTKLLQILEDVCHSQGFIPPEDFKLVQGRKEFDLSLSVRFSSLPNNAKLELARSTTARVEQDVTIALQLDSGQRLQDSFTPSVSLWDLLLHFEEKHGDHKGKLTKVETTGVNSLHPVCIFMREEVIGEQALKATTLKKLALTSGKAIIRLLHRSVEENKIADICDKVEKDKAKQAKLEEIAQKKKELMEEDARLAGLKASMDKQLSNVEEEKMEDDSQQQQPQQSKQQQQQSKQKQQRVTMDVDTEDDTLSSASFSETSSKHRSPQTKSTAGRSGQTTSSRAPNPIDELRDLNIPGVEIFTPDDFSDLSPAEQAIAQRLAQRFLPHLQQAPPPTTTPQVAPFRPQDEQADNAFFNFKFPEETKDKDFSSADNSSSGRQDTTPCERNGLVYNPSELLSSSSQEVPEDFFEVTQSDVKLMYRDLQNAIHQMEEQPLMTKTMRQAQAEAAFDHYQQVVIRVHFPDKLVLQGLFKPRETVQALHSFVKDCLEEPNLKFYLYTTPPKTILKDMKSSLALTHLAPAALVYFGCDQERDHYLKKNLLESMTSRLDAEKSVAKALKQGEDTTDRSSMDTSSDSSTDTRLYAAGPSGMSRASRVSSFTSSTPTTLPSGAKVPKWLKLGKK